MAEPGVAFTATHNICMKPDNGKQEMSSVILCLTRQTALETVYRLNKVCVYKLCECVYSDALFTLAFHLLTLHNIIYTPAANEIFYDYLAYIILEPIHFC